MKVVVAAFNQEKALVGAFSVITNLRMDLFEALVEMGCQDGEEMVGGAAQYTAARWTGIYHVFLSFKFRL